MKKRSSNVLYLKNSSPDITFQDMVEQLEDMIKSERVENRQTVQGLVSFFVTEAGWKNNLRHVYKGKLKNVNKSKQIPGWNLQPYFPKD